MISIKERKKGSGGKRENAGRKPKNGVKIKFTVLSIEKDTRVKFSEIKPKNLTNSNFLSLLLNNYLTDSK